MGKLIKFIFKAPEIFDGAFKRSSIQNSFMHSDIYLGNAPKIMQNCSGWSDLTTTEQKSMFGKISELCFKALP